ncbi:MAG: hypothetical protein WCF38_09990 [Pseudolabrys sp.]
MGEHIAAGDPSERSEHDGGPRSAALSERVMARVAEDWRCFHAQSAAVEIALELPIAFFRDSGRPTLRADPFRKFQSQSGPL